MNFILEKLEDKHYILRDKDKEFNTEVDGRSVNLCFVVEITDIRRSVGDPSINNPISMTVNIFPAENEVSEDYKKQSMNSNTNEYDHFCALSYGTTAPVDPVYYASESSSVIVKNNQLCFKSIEDAVEFAEEDLINKCEDIARDADYHLSNTWNKMGDDGKDTLHKMM